VAEYSPIPVVCGPTGSGKTSVAIALAGELPIEVISADSRQLLKHLDIGTAKPTADEQAAVRTHLIDLIDPGTLYTAYQFIGDSDAAIADIVSRDSIPVIVGGTGLYLRALTDGVVEIEQDRPEIRQRLNEELERLGPEALYRRLEGLDPDEAKRIHPNNLVRILRALEIYELTGQPKSKLVADGAYKRSSYTYSLYCLQPERADLYDRINRRVEAMMQAGLLEEIQHLVAQGWKERLRKARVIGYEELLDYLDERCSLDEAVAMIQQNSRRYAKRQMTWYRHQTECKYFDDAPSLLAALRVELSKGWGRG
jgi:tRNA dimethylallyltransferase